MLKSLRYVDDICVGVVYVCVTQNKKIKSPFLPLVVVAD